METENKRYHITDALQYFSNSNLNSLFSYNDLIFRIAFVRRNSPGKQAGLRVNDVILDVDGHDARKMSHNNLLQYLRSTEKDYLIIIVIQPIQGGTDLVV